MIAAAMLSALPLPASAYTCTMSPAGDAVIVKTDNASDRAVTCKVDCRFTSPQGRRRSRAHNKFRRTAKAGTSACARPAARRCNSPAVAKAAPRRPTKNPA
jgi:hypothetical protein